VSSTKPFPLPVTGIDALSDETALDDGAVREAVNVDIDRDGCFSRRAGRRLIVPGADFHSLWVAKQRGTALVAQGSKLYKYIPGNTPVALSTLNSADPLAYTEYNGNIYWTNRQTLQWLPSDSTVARDAGVPTPAVVPRLSPAPGSLYRGKYGVCLSYVDDRGEEGGATEVQVIELPAGGGIRLEGLETRPGCIVNVYITDTDGEVLRLAARFPAVFPSYTVAEVARGSECETQYLVPMHPGEYITWLAGRLYTAVDDVLYFSNALRPHLYDPAHNFVKFSGFISFIEAVSDGLYVGDSRGVWFLRGTDPTKFEQTLVSTVRAVPRSSIKLPPSVFPDKVVNTQNPVAVWLGDSGYVIGMDSGVVVELHTSRASLPRGLVGRSAYVFKDGIKQVITPVNSPITIGPERAVDSVIQ